MASATSALHLSTVATAADLRPSSSSSAFNASASPNAAVSLCSRPVLPARFRRSSHRPVAIVPLSKGTVSKAPHHTRTLRCEAASSGDATSSSSSPPEAAPTATPAGGAKGHAFIHDFCFGITSGSSGGERGMVPVVTKRGGRPVVAAMLTFRRTSPFTPSLPPRSPLSLLSQNRRGSSGDGRGMVPGDQERRRHAVVFTPSFHLTPPPLSLSLSLSQQERQQWWRA
ncbi:unnamed protein product [Closterium sp. NIES-54]